jgi:hypothetical protein
MKTTIQTQLACTALGVLAIFATACSADTTALASEDDVPAESASDISPIDAPIVSILEADEADGRSPHYIDRLTWGEQSIDFIQVYVDDIGGQTHPSVMISRTVSAAAGDIIDAMHQSSAVALSAAELWMGITGKRDVPAALASDHVAFTRERARNSELSPIDARDIVVEKNAVTDPFFYPVIPAHTWQRKREQSFNIGDGGARYSCSEVETNDNLPLLKAGNVTVSNACSTSYNEGGWVRTGAYNSSFFAEPPLVGQICYGPSTDGAWACFTPAILQKNHARFLDWVTPETNPHKRLGFGLVVEPTLPGSPALWSALWAVGKSVPN